MGVGGGSNYAYILKPLTFDAIHDWQYCPNDIEGKHGR